MRTTNELKDAVIKVRVSQGTRSKLENIARNKGITVSELIRDLVTRCVSDNK